MTANGWREDASRSCAIAIGVNSRGGGSPLSPERFSALRRSDRVAATSGALSFANEVGGAGGARRLASLVAAWPYAELYVFANSVGAAQALAAAWRERALPSLRVLVEFGAGRAGARSLSQA